MKASVARIGDVCTLHRESVPVDSSATYPSVGVLNRGRGLFRKPDLLGADTKYRTLYRISEGQLVYSKLFGWEGAVSMVAPEHAGSYVSAEFPTFDLDESRLRTDYLHHVIGSSAFVEQLSGSTTGMGQRRQRVNVGDFERISIPLPSLSDQRRIAAHLDSIAAATSDVQASTSSLRSTGARLSQQLFDAVDDVAVPLESVLAPKRGEPVQPENQYRITGVFSFGRGLLSRDTIRGYDTKYKSMTQLARGDLVYSKLGAFEGAAAVVSHPFAGSWVSPEFPVFGHSEAVDPDYLGFWVTSSAFEDLLRGAAKGVGARQKRVHPNDFLALPLPLPSLPRQREIAATLSQVADACRLAERRDGLASALLPAARNEVFSSLG